MGLLGTARDLQSDLNRIADRADTGSEDGELGFSVPSYATAVLCQRLKSLGPVESRVVFSARARLERRAPPLLDPSAQGA